MLAKARQVELVTLREANAALKEQVQALRHGGEGALRESAQALPPPPYRPPCCSNNIHEHEMLQPHQWGGGGEATVGDTVGTTVGRGARGGGRRGM